MLTKDGVAYLQAGGGIGNNFIWPRGGLSANDAQCLTVLSTTSSEYTYVIKRNKSSC
jgi:hypothetical protein